MARLFVRTELGKVVYKEICPVTLRYIWIAKRTLRPQNL